ncbi:MAG: FG-GAP repeat domain-containing protein [Isosphaeraceae bacterium]
MSVRNPCLSLSLLLSAWCLSAPALAQERTVIDANFPGAYQVEVKDVNGDNRPDVIAVGGSTCAWYENPTWKKRVVTTGKQTPGIISSATADLDGDGKAEIAIAYEFEMNRPATGKLLLARQGSGPDDPWKLEPIADVPSIHRLRWGDLEGNGRLDLVVAPIFGREARPPDFTVPAKLQVFSTRQDPEHRKWTSTVVGARPVIHAIEVTSFGGVLRSQILTASNEGVSLFLLMEGTGPVPLSTGASGQAPKRGSSEVHLGRLADGKWFLATIEPWHGSEVVVAVERRNKPGSNDAAGFGPRLVIDDTLADGHALWVADIDGDRNDEIFVGHRGKDHRVSMYKLDHARQSWTRTVIDREVAAQDLRGADVDGDGTPDVVAVGGSTHNVVLYRFPRR